VFVSSTCRLWLNAERVLFAGIVGVEVAYGFAAAFATAVVGLLVGVRAIRQATI
jgi:hypothetical protein